MLKPPFICDLHACVNRQPSTSLSSICWLSHWMCLDACFYLPAAEAMGCHVNHIIAASIRILLQSLYF